MDTLLDSGKYSDLRITCRGQSWNVHRAVVCTASPVFEAMIDGWFQEAQSGIIDLLDDEPEIVEMMLRFIYQGEYDDESRAATQTNAPPDALDDAPPDAPEAINDTPPRSYTPLTYPPSSFPLPPCPLPPCPSHSKSQDALLANVKVYVIADKHDIPTLKDHARHKYAEIVKGLWDTSGFEESARLTFECTLPGDALRDVVAGVAAIHIRALIKDEGFVEVLNEHGELAVDVLKKVLAWREMRKLEDESADVDPWQFSGFGVRKKKEKKSRPTYECSISVDGLNLSLYTCSSLVHRVETTCDNCR